MRLVVPFLALMGAVACFWAALTGKTFYRRENALLGTGKPLRGWQARLGWVLFGLLCLLAVLTMVT